MRHRFLVVVFFLLFSWQGAVALDIPFEMSKKSQNNLVHIYKLAKEQKWDEAARLAMASGDRSIMLFVKALKETGSGHGAYDEEKMRKLLDYKVATTYKGGNVEAKMVPVGYSADKIISEYNHSSRGNKDAAARKVRNIWRNRTFSVSEEERFYNKFKILITMEDNNTRMDNLLWSDQVEAARRMLPRIGGSAKKLLQLRYNIRTAKTYTALKHLLSGLKETELNTNGVLYEQVLWMHASKNMYRDVVKQLVKMPAPRDHKYHWWLIGRYYIRDFLTKDSTDKMHRVAYIISTKFKPVSGAEAADAEWTAGWVALRFLKMPNLAYKHFVQLYNSSYMINTLSRAAYWAALSSRAMYDKQQEAKWYTVAAMYPTTFYGQLATASLHKTAYLHLPKYNIDPRVTANVRNNIAAKFLYYAGIVQDAQLATVLVRISINNTDNPEEMELITSIPMHFMMAKVSIEGAKFAAMQKRVLLITPAYPIQYTDYANNVIDMPLCLALIRKESSFNRFAKSPLDARGLMQLTPKTAQDVAGKLNMKIHLDKLFDPKTNILLGSHYLNKILDSNNKNIVTTLVAYNAGGGNLKKIIAEYGDPRKMDDVHDIVDWIESIPFHETREHVHRVIESVQVYRALLFNNGNPTKLNIINDLRGKYAR